MKKTARQIRHEAYVRQHRIRSWIFAGIGIGVLGITANLLWKAFYRPAPPDLQAWNCISKNA